MIAIDLDALIVPGIGAAGLRLGMTENELSGLLKSGFVRVVFTHPLFKQEPPAIRYESPDVVIYFENDRVDQIGVRKAYRGAFKDRFRLGCTVEELRSLGRIGEDGSDNLVIRGIPGFCFEVEPVPREHCMTPEIWRVAWFFVHDAPGEDWSPLTLWDRESTGPCPEWNG